MLENKSPSQTTVEENNEMQTEVENRRVLLEIKDLDIIYSSDKSTVRAVNHLNLEVRAGETVGFVGETGAGKTTTARGILRLIPNPPGEIVNGEIIFDGQNLLTLDKEEMRKIRGGRISMIFQDPMTSLNPSMTVGKQIEEVLGLHESLEGVERTERAKEMLRLVGIKAERIDDFPHQFSGGMKQRVVIAMALACNPQLLIADEPTTALDVTIQAQVLKLMNELKIKLNTAMLLITHDLGVVAHTCDRVAIMYAGSVLESGTTIEIFDHPQHPYTQGLFASIPDLDKDTERLEVIPGMPPDPSDLPPGCCFAPRCPYALDICNRDFPETVRMEGRDHAVACYRISHPELFDEQVKKEKQHA